jgi:hypothetical protein
MISAASYALALTRPQATSTAELDDIADAVVGSNEHRNPKSDPTDSLLAKQPDFGRAAPKHGSNVPIPRPIALPRP